MRIELPAIAVRPMSPLRSFLDGERIMRLHASAVAALLGMLAISSGAASAAQVGAWQFDNNLSNGVPGGAAMVINGGWGETYAATTIAGNPATVLSFPALTNTQSLQMPNQAAANGGGTKTNVWSIVMD